MQFVDFSARGEYFLYSTYSKMKIKIFLWKCKILFRGYSTLNNVTKLIPRGMIFANEIWWKMYPHIHLVEIQVNNSHRSAYKNIQNMKFFPTVFGCNLKRKSFDVNMLLFNIELEIPSWWILNFWFDFAWTVARTRFQFHSWNISNLRLEKKKMRKVWR